MQKMVHLQKYTLFVVIITSFMTTFIGSALNLSIPAISLEFRASAVMTGWIITGYMLAAAALSVPFGRLSDMTGRKRILISGITIFALSSGLCAAAQSIAILLAFRVIQGIGAAMIFSTNTAVLISAFRPDQRGIVLGYSISATYIGLTAGPVLGGMLNHYFGWRSIFAVTCALGALIVVLAVSRLEDAAPGSRGEKLDGPGNLLYIAMIICIMYGLSAFSTVSYARYLIPAGVLFLILFVLRELKIKDPIVEVRLFYHNPAYLFSNLAALMNYGATFALGYLLSVFLQLVMGFDSQAAGFVLISQPLLMALLSPAAGRLSDRISPYKLASFGMALTALGLGMFVFISEGFPLWLIILNLIVIGIGFAFFSSPNTNAVMSCVEKKDYGVASSILATMRSLGHTASMAAVTLIMASRMGSASFNDVETSLLIDTMRTSFIFFSLICAVGVFFSFKRRD